MRLSAQLIGVVCLAVAAKLVWRRPEAAWLFALLLAPLALALHRIARRGQAGLAWFALFAGVAAWARLRHGFIPATWYVDYMCPADAASVPVTYVQSGLAGLLRCLPSWTLTANSVVFALSVSCSSLAVGLLAAALWRYQQRPWCRWPPGTFALWGLLLSTDAILTYLGASDAHHNVALLAFSLALWWYGEALSEDEQPAAPVLAPAMVLLGSAFVGATRMELLLAPLAIPLLLPPDKARLRDGRFLRACAALGLGLLAAWFLISYRRPVSWVLKLHPSTWSQSLAFLWGQSPLSGATSLPPWLVQPWLRLSFALCLCSACFGRPVLLAAMGAFFLLVLPKIAGGYGEASIACCHASQRFDIIAIPVMLLLAAAGAAWALGWAPSLWKRLLGQRGERLLSGLGLAALGAALLLGSRLQPALLPLPYQAEFDFLSRSLAAIPEGGVVMAPWLETLPSGRDADTGLAVPHALLVRDRPDIRWLRLRPGDPIPAQRPAFFFKGACCGLDSSRGATGGPDVAADHKAIEEMLRTCSRLEKMTARWDARATFTVRESTLHIQDGRLDLGLGWMPAAKK